MQHFYKNVPGDCSAFLLAIPYALDARKRADASQVRRSRIVAGRSAALSAAVILPAASKSNSIASIRGMMVALIYATPNIANFLATFP